MFTGLIEEVGILKRIERGAEHATITIKARQVLTDVNIGDSIAVNGICLTVVSHRESEFTADVMEETFRRTNLCELKSGSFVNLERALRIGDRLGGHIVSGHVDGVGIIEEIKKDHNAFWYRIRSSKELLSLVVEKGSIAIDGISLTVAKVTKQDFSVSIIPHTLSKTALQQRKVKDKVNLENDMIGKYVQKQLLAMQQPTGSQASHVTSAFLMENGFF